MRNSVVSRNDRLPSRISWNCRSLPSVVRARVAPAAAIFISSRSRLSRSSTANCLNIVADIGLGRFSASFSNVLYASTVYWNMRPSCCSLSVAVVSTAVMLSLYLCYLHNHVTNQFRLTRQPIGRFQFLVGFIGSWRSQQVPAGAEDFDSARAAGAVAAAYVADDTSHLQRA